MLKMIFNFFYQDRTCQSNIICLTINNRISLKKLDFIVKLYLNIACLVTEYNKFVYTTSLLQMLNVVNVTS